MEVFPHNKEDIYELFAIAVQQECRWTNHIISNNVLGITEKSTEEYTKYLANIRLRAIGLDELYPEYQKSPYKHLEKMSDTKSNGNTKANFFESGVTSYVMSTGIDGWDKF